MASIPSDHDYFTPDHPTRPGIRLPLTELEEPFHKPLLEALEAAGVDAASLEKSAAEGAVVA